MKIKTHQNNRTYVAFVLRKYPAHWQFNFTAQPPHLAKKFSILELLLTEKLLRYVTVTLHPRELDNLFSRNR